MEAFLLVRLQGGFSPKSLFLSLRVCTADLFLIFLQDFVAKAYWGLNMSVGISLDLRRRPPAQIQAAISTNCAKGEPMRLPWRGSRDVVPARTRAIKLKPPDR